MNIASRWKITYDPAGSNPVVLVDNGQQIDAEIPWSVERPMEVVPLVDSAVPFIRPSGNASFRIDFTAFESRSTDYEARFESMAWLEYWQTLPKKPLKIQFATAAGGVLSLPYFIFSSCFISSFQPSRIIENGSPILAKKYSIIAAGLTRVTS